MSAHESSHRDLFGQHINIWRWFHGRPHDLLIEDLKFLYKLKIFQALDIFIDVFKFKATGLPHPEDLLWWYYIPWKPSVGLLNLDYCWRNFNRFYIYISKFLLHLEDFLQLVHTLKAMYGYSIPRCSFIGFLHTKDLLCIICTQQTCCRSFIMDLHTENSGSHLLKKTRRPFKNSRWTSLRKRRGLLMEEPKVLS